MSAIIIGTDTSGTTDMPIAIGKGTGMTMGAGTIMSSTMIEGIGMLITSTKVIGAVEILIGIGIINSCSGQE